MESYDTRSLPRQLVNVTIPRPVIEPLVPAVLDPREHVAARGRGAGQCVGDHHAWLLSLSIQDTTQDTTEEGLGCFLVAPLLDEDVQHRPVLVSRPPPPVRPASALHRYFIEMPRVTWPGAAPPRPISDCLPELPALAADRLVARSDAALGEQLLHVPVPQQEAVVQQHGGTDALAWEPVARVQRRWLVHHRAYGSVPTTRQRVSVTMPALLPNKRTMGCAAPHSSGIVNYAGRTL